MYATVYLITHFCSLRFSPPISKSQVHDFELVWDLANSGSHMYKPNKLYNLILAKLVDFDLAESGKPVQIYANSLNYLTS